MNRIRTLICALLGLFIGGMSLAAEYDIIPTLLSPGYDFTTCIDDYYLLCENTSLSQVAGIGGQIHGVYGAKSINVVVSTKDDPLENAGVFFYSNDGSILTAQFQCKSATSAGGIFHCIKVELVQRGTDIYGKVAYNRSWTGRSLGASWIVGSDWDPITNANGGYKTYLYDLFLIKADESDQSGSVLTWNGGSEGSWNGNSENWLTEANSATKWIPGSYARFTSPAQVTVSGEQEFFGFIVDCAGEVSIEGDALVAHESQANPVEAVFTHRSSILRLCGEVRCKTGFALATEYRNTDIGTQPPVVDVQCNLSPGRSLVICGGTVFKVSGEGCIADGEYSNPISCEGVFSYESSVEQNLAGACASSGNGYYYIAAGSKVKASGGYGEPASADLRIAGEFFANQFRALPTDGAGTRVLTGGVLIGGEVNGDWGFSEAKGPINLDPGSTMILAGQWNLGCFKPVYVNGGHITNSIDAEQLIYKFYMSNGARYSGARADAGYNAYYSADSVLSVTGTSPCFFEAERFYIGADAPNAQEDYQSVLRLEVSDVTGDAATDLYLSSRLLEMNSHTIVDPYYFGITKRGQGTVELSGADNALTNGVFKLDGGTVRLAANCSGILPPIMLISDTTIDVNCTELQFGDSSAWEWNAGAKLNLTGTLKRGRFRIGNSPDGLTEDQFAALRYNGKAVKIHYEPDGSLFVDTTLSMIIK